MCSFWSDKKGSEGATRLSSDSLCDGHGARPCLHHLVFTDKRANQAATRLERRDDVVEHCFSDDPALSVDHDAISRPILEAINVRKAELI